MLWVYVWVPLNCFWHFLTIYDLLRLAEFFFRIASDLRWCQRCKDQGGQKKGRSHSAPVDFSRSEQTTQLPWRIHGAAIYGVPWIPSTPVMLACITSTSRIRHGALGGCFCFFFKIWLWRLNIRSISQRWGLDSMNLIVGKYHVYGHLQQ